jgi:hypothetical protein
VTQSEFEGPVHRRCQPPVSLPSQRQPKSPIYAELMHFCWPSGHGLKGRVSMRLTVPPFPSSSPDIANRSLQQVGKRWRLPDPLLRFLFSPLPPSRTVDPTQGVIDPKVKVKMGVMRITRGTRRVAYYLATRRDRPNVRVGLA